MFSRRWLFTTLIVMAGIVLTIRLGIWQIDRYHQNKAFSDHLAAMQVASQIVIKDGNPTENLAAMEYRAVEASGTFDYSHQIAIRNQIWVQSWGNDPGYILVTPLILSDGTAVMVDRGWIPLKDDNPDSWKIYDINGPVTVNGIIRLQTNPEIGGEPDPTLAPGQEFLSLWNLIDLDRLQSQMPYRLLNVYIQQGPSPDSSELPYRALASPDLSASGTNAAYATMWFLFTGLLIFGYPVYLRKQTLGTSKR
jgi:cytochrome oxidase assembly protein ShyY1